MIIREDAIYGRQSVDRKDSISIESQIEFCKYEVRGGNFRKYTDNETADEVTVALALVDGKCVDTNSLVTLTKKKA